MIHSPNQIADPAMLRRLHSFTTSPINSIQRSADSVLESIWCNKPQPTPNNTSEPAASNTPEPVAIPRGFGGYGACEACFEHRLLLRGYCLDCDAFLRQPW